MNPGSIRCGIHEVSKLAYVLPPVLELPAATGSESIEK
jgi:hypothetical protein